MDTNLSGIVLDGAVHRLREPGEDGYYSTFSEVFRAPGWARRLGATCGRYMSGETAPAGLRSIAVTGAIVFLYCALVPLAPILLFQSA